MSYSEPLSAQVWVFLAFLGVGFLLGALSLFFRVLRALLGGGGGATAAYDLLFCFCAFALLFAACLGYTDGVWRLPELLAAAAGFWAFRRSVGAILQPPLVRAAAALRRRGGALLRPVRVLADRLQAVFSARMLRLRQGVSARLEQRKTRRREKPGAAEKNRAKKAKNHAKALAKPNKVRYNDI